MRPVHDKWPSPFLSSGQLIKEGNIRRKRFFVLTDTNQLRYYKSENTRQPVSGCIHLNWYVYLYRHNIRKCIRVCPLNMRTPIVMRMITHSNVYIQLMCMYTCTSWHVVSCTRTCIAIASLVRSDSLASTYSSCSLFCSSIYTKVNILLGTCRLSYGIHTCIHQEYRLV